MNNGKLPVARVIKGNKASRAQFGVATAYTLNDSNFVVMAADVATLKKAISTMWDKRIEFNPSLVYQVAVLQQKDVIVEEDDEL